MKRIFCFLFGHTWLFYYRYNNSTQFKCFICEGYCNKFGPCKPKKYKKAWYKKT